MVLNSIGKNYEVNLQTSATMRYRRTENQNQEAELKII